jgi:hypothetical protein
VHVLIARDRPNFFITAPHHQPHSVRQGAAKVGEPFGDVFFQDIAIVVAKAIAYRNQSLSSRFSASSAWGPFIIRSPGEATPLVPCFRFEEAQSQSSFLTQLHKLLGPNEIDVAYLCGAHNSILAPAKSISGPEQCRLCDIIPFKP